MGFESLLMTLLRYIGVVVALIALFPGAAQCRAEEPNPAPRIGSFRLEFTPQELLGEDAARQAADILHTDDPLSWQVHVPQGYDPDVPAGVLVYVSPQSKAAPPGIWKKALRDKNLIWIGAANAGNRVAVGKRMFLAMLAPRVLARDYELDEQRIYVAGFSGGGKAASRVAVAQPEVFRGGIYIAGAEMWGSQSPPPKLERIRENRHVFLTGTLDFNENLTRRVYAAYKKEGVENSELIIVRRHGHELPDRATFIRAIDYLDLRN